MLITATRYHDFSAGHIVMGHEGKCQNLHGHNYRVHFTIAATKLDAVGRVLDFNVIKGKLCDWLESMWDHKFLISIHHPWASDLVDMDPVGVVLLGWNPTAENMAVYLLDIVGPDMLHNTGAQLISVKVEETRKCSAAADMQTLLQELGN